MLLEVLRSSGWSSCFALNHRSVGVRTSERQLVTENSDLTGVDTFCDPE